MKYTKFTVQAPSAWEEPLTMVLYLNGAPALQIEDPSIIAEHLAKGEWDASVFDGQIIETGQIVLHAIFPADTRLDLLRQDIAALSPEHSSLFNISTASLPEQDWQQIWRDSFPTLKPGKSLVISPYWRKSGTNSAQTTVYVSPGQAFGTGDHATTALMLQLLEDWLPAGCKVADIGSGSGILAISALKLGAAQALAIDNDPLCKISIAEHMTINDIAKEALTFGLGDILKNKSLQRQLQAFQADLLLSNIVASVIIELAALSAGFVAEGGLWICGGILREKEPQVLKAFSANKWQILHREENGEWLGYVVCFADQV